MTSFAIVLAKTMPATKKLTPQATAWLPARFSGLAISSRQKRWKKFGWGRLARGAAADDDGWPRGLFRNPGLCVEAAVSPCRAPSLSLNHHSLHFSQSFFCLGWMKGREDVESGDDQRRRKFSRDFLLSRRPFSLASSEGSARTSADFYSPLVSSPSAGRDLLPVSVPWRIVPSLSK